MPPVAGTTHHLVLNGVGYMLRQGKEGRLAWKRGERRYFDALRWVADQRQAQARPGQDNKGLDQGVQLSYGLGGYGRGVGVDGRNGDGLRISSTWDTVTGGAIVINAMVDFNSTMYAGATTGTKKYVYKYSAAGVSLTEVGSAGGAAVYSLVAFGNILWFGTSTPDTGTLSTADAYTATSGANSSGQGLGRTGVNCWTWIANGSGGYLAVSSGMGATQAFTAVSATADPNEPTRWMGVEKDGALYLGMDNGLYKFTDAAPGTRSRVADWTWARATGNGWPMVAWKNYLWYQVGGSLYRFDGSNEKGYKVPALLVGASGQGTVGGKVAGLAVTPNWLLVAIVTNEATPAIECFAFDGDETWHHLGVVGSGSAAVVNSMWYSPNVAQVFVNYTAGGSSATKRLRLTAGSDLPYAAFATTGNYVYLPPVDAGLPEVTKRWYSVVVRGRDISATNAVDVEYWNGSTWVAVGTLTTAGGGEVVFGSTVSSGSLLLRLELNGSASTTPVVQEVSVNYDYLPGPLKTVEMELMLGPNLRLLDGTTETNTPTQLMTALETARAGGTVVALSDPLVSGTSGSALNVRVVEVDVSAWGLVPDSNSQYGWIAKVLCEVVG